jgi:exodeoxyribonuclease V alpha subunit
VSEAPLKGTVRQEVFRNEAGTFAVVRVSAPGQGVVTVTGALPPVHPGETLEVEGEWVSDPKFGRQFQAQQARASAPNSSDAIKRFLASGAVNGIGPELAGRIVKAFGDETVKILDEEPKRLLEVRGIGKKKLGTIEASWEDQRSVRETMLFLRGHGLGPALAGRVHEQWGAQARRILADDPYRLAREVDGAGFLTADRLAGALGVSGDDPRRLRAGLLHVAHEALSDGHTAVVADQLVHRASQALGAGDAWDALDDALLDARQEGTLELDRAAGGLDVVYLPELLRAERGAAHLSATLADPGAARRFPPIDAEKAITWLHDQGGVELSGDQAEAVRALAESSLVVITGGPGVGKTTVVRSLVEIMQAKRASFSLAAPTGRAAKRLEEATGSRAMTLHRLLEWDPRQGGFVRNESFPLELDALVVDEASMIDLKLFHALLRALPPGASLVLTGDVDQLPSVGAGSVLADLIKSGVPRVVRLTEVFRQAARSRIVASAHAINQGAVPDLATHVDDGTDFFFVAKESPADARDMIVRLVTERIPARFGLDPVRDVQVLAPMRKGLCGTEALNRALKSATLPGAQLVEERGRLRPDPGDKVMQLKNDYERDVFNGDVGRVLDRDDQGELIVRFDDREVRYTRAQARQLALAYCATIHKAQGSEYPAVVLPVLTEHFVMLQRNLLYTGITRARRLVVLVGQRRAVETAVSNDRPRQRLGFLADRLREAAGQGL